MFCSTRVRKEGEIFGSDILFQAGITVVTSTLSKLSYIQRTHSRLIGSMPVRSFKICRNIAAPVLSLGMCGLRP
jgi:hypothetical protein